MNTLERLIESDDHIELMEHILPTRSVLYNLEPVGVGTPYAESLTSYISRLASIHNLPISIFIESLIAPILSSNIVKRGKSGVKYTEMSKYINGNTTITTGYINTIEKLTSRNDIQYLTMNNWKGIFPNNIIDVHRKWCPLCLNSMKTESEIIYEPLIWYIAGVSKCTIHEITLHNKCPYCQKQVPYLMKNFMVGHCPYCFKWFGSKKPQLKESLTQKEDFISKNFMELIMKAPFSNSFPSRKSIGIVLNKIKEELDFKYISELAKFLETDKRKSYSWSNSKVIPQPEQLMNIAEKTKSSIYYLFCNNKFELNVDTSSINREKVDQKKASKKEIKEYLIQAVNSEIPKSLSRVAREGAFSINTAKYNFPELAQVIIDNFAEYKKQLSLERKLEIEKMLYDCLNSDTPISLNEFSRRYNISLSTVRRMTPELGKKVALRYKKYTDKIQAEYREKILNELETIIHDLHQKNLFPSVKRIQKIISNPQVMRHDYFKGKRKDILNGLGIVYRENSTHKIS